LGLPDELTTALSLLMATFAEHGRQVLLVAFAELQGNCLNGTLALNPLLPTDMVYEIVGSSIDAWRERLKQ
jgi:hypothetical protein